MPLPQHVASAASGGVVSLVKVLLYFLPFHVVWTELDWSDKFLSSHSHLLIPMQEGS